MMPQGKGCSQLDIPFLKFPVITAGLRDKIFKKERNGTKNLRVTLLRVSMGKDRKGERKDAHLLSSVKVEFQPSFT